MLAVKKALEEKADQKVLAKAVLEQKVLEMALVVEAKVDLAEALEVVQDQVAEQVLAAEPTVVSKSNLLYSETLVKAVSLI